MTPGAPHPHLTPTSASLQHTQLSAAPTSLHDKNRTFQDKTQPGAGEPLMPDFSWQRQEDKAF